MILRSSVSVLAALLATAATGRGPGVPVTLAGSPESMERQFRVARESGYALLRTPAEVRRAVEAGELVRVRSAAGLALKDPREDAARPEVRHFLEHFAAEYAACGERLVVTSLTRPRTRQPHNAHPLSVHPAGLAVDLRVPRSARCRRALETKLLGLEDRGVLDATRERSPAHYHVALFPAPYLAYAGLGRPVAPEVVAPPPAPPLAEPPPLAEAPLPAPGPQR